MTAAASSADGWRRLRLAPSTRQRYRRWRDEWERSGIASSADWLAALAGRGLSRNTVLQAGAAVRWLDAHAMIPPACTHDPLEAHDVLAGIRRAGRQGPGSVDPLLWADVDRAVTACPDTPDGRADRVILGLGSDLLLRAGEIAALTVADMAGLPAVTLRRSKTDQEGRGWTGWCNDATCHDVQRHIAQAQLADGPLLPGANGRAPTPRSISQRVAAAAARAGLRGRFTAHSLRRGAAQSLAAAGAPLPVIMELGRWTEQATVTTYLGGMTDAARYAAGLRAGRTS